MTSKFELWSAACSGNISVLRHYYDNGGAVNTRFTKFGKSHSLIMGAYRNQQYKTVDYLLSVGETITDQERPEFMPYIVKEAISAARKVTDYFAYHNKNLTNKQYYLVDDLQDELKKIPVDYFNFM